MIVEVLGYTNLSKYVWDVVRFPEGKRIVHDEFFVADGGATDADILGEIAGRQCYRSWGKPNPETATNRDYLLKSIIQRGHFSVLEHATVTFRVTGVSRNLLLEFERHRHISLSVVSQRFVDSSEEPFVVPPAVLDSQDTHIQNDINSVVNEARAVYNRVYEALTAEGLPRKQAREAARAVLPGGTATDLIVTANLRAWREIISKRNSPEADREIKAFAAELLRHLKMIAPNSFQDMEI